MLLRIVVFSLCLALAGGFRCYACSYSRGQDAPPRTSTACVESPADLDPTFQVNCRNSCVTIEQFDKKTKAITSFLRSCNVAFDPNPKCTEDVWSYFYQMSCEGNLCNERHVRSLDSGVSPPFCATSCKGCEQKNSYSKGGAGAMPRGGSTALATSLLIVFELLSWILVTNFS